MSDLGPNDLSIMEKLKEASQKSISEFFNNRKKIAKVLRKWLPKCEVIALP